jgi:hypothetical protein
LRVIIHKYVSLTGTKKCEGKRSFAIKRRISATWWQRYAHVLQFFILLPFFVGECPVECGPCAVQNESKRKRKQEKEGKSKKEFKF